jgi:hypothetical protein
LVSQSNRGEVYWPLHYLIFMILYYTTEGQLVHQDSLYWALYVAVTVAVASVPVAAEESELDSEQLEAEAAMALPPLAPAQSWSGSNV